MRQDATMVPPGADTALRVMQESDKRAAQRLAQVIKDRRGTLGLSQRELAKRADVHANTVRKLEQSKVTHISDAAMNIERALGWAPGAFHTIRQGGTPTPLEEASREHNPVTRDLANEFSDIPYPLLQRLTQNIKAYETFTTPDGGEMVLFYTKDEEADRWAARTEYTTWERAQRSLKHSLEDEDK